MNKYLNRRSLFSALAFAIGLAAGLGTIAEVKASDYNGLTSKPTPVVELVPSNKASPVRIIGSGSIGSH